MGALKVTSVIQFNPVHETN